MPIKAFLRDERGETLDSVLGLCLRPLIPAMDDGSSPCLRFIDPYGDTMFNVWQAKALLRELASRRSGADGVDQESIDRLAALVARCAEGIHLYLWFVGD